MPIIYRLEADHDLSAAEIDGNFRDLDDRVADIEEAGPVSIQQIDQDEDTGSITITLTDSSEHGPFIIPTAVWHDQGPWTNSTPYAPGDIVQVPGVGIFLVLEPHTTPAEPEEFDPEAVNGSDEPLYVQIGSLPAVINPIAFAFYGTIPFEGATQSDGQLIGTFVLIEAHLIEAGAPLAKAWLDTPAGSSEGILIDIEKNGSVIGQVEFETGENEGVFTFENDVEFAAGDRVQLRVVEADGVGGDMAVTLPALRMN